MRGNRGLGPCTKQSPERTNESSGGGVGWGLRSRWTRVSQDHGESSRSDQTSWME